ncbi:DUF7305 domain-containing protein [Nannocystis radixulma]|uniref:DUF7305 domain-containing protein n=1 Tax=Nannocystis radixulma TaxID=2995305 RepID=A0ABT5B0D9_9BACT|nr:hypothetical protein [Nannocystis radixulma]MDC0667203.1 hypothetical protein [Nannocystis radixulma]
MARRSVGWMVAVVMTACGGSGGDGTATGLSGATTMSGSTGTATGTGTEAPTTEAPTTGTTVSGGVSESTGTATGTGEPTTTTSTTSTTGTTTTGSGSETTSDTSTGGTTGAVDFCEGEGGILLPGDEVTCTGDLGKKTFLFAICSCSGLTANNSLKTDSFDSNDPNMVPMDGGSVGVNGPYSAASMVDIGGSLWVDGKIQTFNAHEVAQQLKCTDDLTAGSASHVADDLFTEGNLFAQNMTLTIDGDLHIPANKNNNGAQVLGQTIKEPVDVKTPCDCEDLIDVAQIVGGYMLDNDNAALPIAPDELVGLPQPKSVELPCGRYFFSAIDSNSSLDITLTGRTVIAVAGDVQNAGAFHITLGPEAELDLFIAGNANFNNVASIGDPKRPAATRIYVGGAFKFASNFTLGANLYQPNAVFTANNMSEIWGSLFVGGLQLASPLVVHYDQAILDLDGCDDPGQGCGDCHDCANPTPACTEDGTCGPCVVDDDCCPPLVCDAGICKAIIPQ